MRAGLVLLLGLVLAVTADDLRPQYHAVPPSNWMNDPNGPIFYKGLYHLFFQYNPDAAVFGVINWGHMVSSDLIQWQWKGVALTPGENISDPDHTGCWTGSAAIDTTGTNLPTIIYTGVRTPDHLESQMIAVAKDDEISSWVKADSNPIIAEPPFKELPGRVSGFRDPSFWFDEELGQWRMIIGSGVKGVGGYILMYTADKLQGPWTYQNPLYYNNNTQYHGDMWECPDFFELSTISGNSSRWVLIFGDDRAQRNFYMIGAFDKVAGVFIPDPAFQRGGLILDAGNYYASKTMLDSNSGQRILWGWSPEARTQAAYKAAGWAGIQTIPRVLALCEDLSTLHFAPVPTLDGIINGFAQSGNQVKIRASFRFQTGSEQEVGLYVFKSSDKREFTKISFIPKTRMLTISRNASSLSPEADSSPISLVVPRNEVKDNELYLIVLLDHSIIEVIANSVACITARVYPTLPDSTGIQYYSPPFSAAIVAFRSIYSS